MDNVKKVCNFNSATWLFLSDQPRLLSNGYPGVKDGRGVTLTTHPHLVPRSRMSRSYTSSPPKRLHGVQRDCFTCLFIWFI
jgi:hypothetical protein